MTRSILLLWPLILAVVLLDGCKREPDAPIAPKQDNSWLHVYTDTDTGCEYIGQGAPNAGITPRMDRDGKQICKEASWDVPQQKRLN